MVRSSTRRGVKKPSAGGPRRRRRRCEQQKAYHVEPGDRSVQDLGFMKNRGIVYACSHEAWLEETSRSALSAKGVMPHLERELYIAENIIPADRTILESAFTRIVPLQWLDFR